MRQRCVVMVEEQTFFVKQGRISAIRRRNVQYFGIVEPSDRFALLQVIDVDRTL